MYLCIKVSLCGVPMESCTQLGLGEGPIKSGSNVPTPRYHRYHVTHAASYSHTCAFSELTLIKAAKGVLYPHVLSFTSDRFSDYI